MYVDVHQLPCEKNVAFIANALPNVVTALGEDLKRTTEETAVVLLDILLPYHMCWQKNKILRNLC
jgi:hypothetical protein